MHDPKPGLVDRLFKVSETGFCRVVFYGGGLGREVDLGVVDVVLAPEGPFYIQGAGCAVHPGDLKFRFLLFLRHGTTYSRSLRLKHLLFTNSLLQKSPDMVEIYHYRGSNLLYITLYIWDLP